MCKVFAVGNICGMARTMKFMVPIRNDQNIFAEKFSRVFISQSSHNRENFLITDNGNHKLESIT